MPLVRMVTSVACDDLPGVAGDEVTLSPDRARQVVDAGWGVLVREERSETPEAPPGAPPSGMETTELRRTRRRSNRG